MARPLRVLALLTLGVLATAVPALAVSPGENGRIYFHSCGNPCTAYNIYSVAPGGGDLVNLTGALIGPEGLPDEAFEPTVSADGSRIAFSVDTQADSEIWVINADGSGAHQLTHDNLLDQAPAMSPDGSRIVCTHPVSNPTRMRRLPCAANTRRPPFAARSSASSGTRMLELESARETRARRERACTSSSIARKRAGNTRANGRASGTSASAAAKRRGCGSTAASSARRPRSSGGRRYVFSTCTRA